MEGLSIRLSEISKDLPRGWQAELAKKCGVKPASVSDWVSGVTKKLEAAHLFNAADYFGVQPRWLAFGVGPKTSGQAASSPAPTPASSLHHALEILDQAISKAPLRTRDELRKLFDLYLGDPSRYHDMVEMIEGWLSGGEPSSPSRHRANER